jgi:class 3 adenylate cyclase
LRIGLPLGVAVGGLYVIGGFLRFDTGHVPDLVYPPLALIASAVAGLGVRLRGEAQQRRHLTDVLGQYVSPSVARQLVERRPARGSLPSGTITFLFTDVVGSTRAWEREPQAMGQAMRRHDALIDEAVQECGGALVRPRGEGDSRFAVFVDPADAVRAAMAVQQCLTTEDWTTTQPVRVRMALHTGAGELREGDYYGSPVNRCARIRSLAEPGQTLLSSATADAVASALPTGAELRDLGTRELKDLSEPEHVYELAPKVASAP